jgi:hypothetical protein
MYREERKKSNTAREALEMFATLAFAAVASPQFEPDPFSADDARGMHGRDDSVHYSKV